MEITQVDCEYECLGCGARWLNMRGPQRCPKCKHLYVRWTNYEELLSSGKLKGAHKIGHLPEEYRDTA